MGSISFYCADLIVIYFLILFHFIILNAINTNRPKGRFIDTNCLKQSFPLRCKLLQALRYARLTRRKRQNVNEAAEQDFALNERLKESLNINNKKLVTKNLTLLSQKSFEQQVRGPIAIPTPIPTSTLAPVTCQNNGVFSTNMKRAIVTEHNENRRDVDPPASNMRFMTWDDELAWLAASRTSTCVFKEDDAFAQLRNGQSPVDIQRHSVVGTEVGYNWFAWENTPNLPDGFIWDVMDGWMSEKRFYNHQDRTCSSVCRHYLQVRKDQ